MCPNSESNFYLSANALSSLSIRTNYRRQKMLHERVVILEPKKIHLDDDRNSFPLHLFDLKNVIQQRLQHRTVSDGNRDTIPLYAKGMKDRFPNVKIVTSILDSPAFSLVMDSVPQDMKPAIMLGIYADDIDRDQAPHSSQKSKLHCTYVRILNEINFGAKSKNDYELIMIANSDTIKKHTYDKCMEPIINNLSEVIDKGVWI